MSLREKLLRVAPEEWENEFVRIRPMATRDDLIYAGDGCRLTDEQREFVNPVWFSLGRAYLAPEEHYPCLIENERREPIGFLCFTAWADAYSWSYFLDARQQGRGYGKRAAQLALRLLRLADPDMPRSSWPWRLPTHGRSGFTARWASGSCRSGTATISYSAWRRILMDDLVFRRAGKTDLPHILAMQADIFHGEQGIPDDDVGAFLQKRPICWCAGSGGVLCAAAAAWQEGSETHWGRFVVLPAFRGRHIGSRLARFSFDDLFAMGVDRIHMDARETTVRIVCGMGGRIVGEPAAFYRGTVTPVVLERHAYRAI